MTNLVLDCLVILHFKNKTKDSKREFAMQMFVDSDDLPAKKIDVMRTVLDKHMQYIELLININARKKWADWARYTYFEFGVVQITNKADGSLYVWEELTTDGVQK